MSSAVANYAQSSLLFKNTKFSNNFIFLVRLGYFLTFVMFFVEMVPFWTIDATQYAVHVLTKRHYFLDLLKNSCWSESS